MGQKKPRDLVDYARWISGGLCLAAGIAKAFPQVEDVAATLELMAAANAANLLGPLSAFLVAHVALVTTLVGLALGLTGLAFLTNRYLVVACLIQLVLFSCFVTFLFSAIPAILLVDAPFFAVTLLVLWRALAPPRAHSHPSLIKE
ncbi:DUF6041 domain-containing protein [Thioclava sp. GXIMD4215]|uniref:DUF6041 domain-containing protein n=1 Tax=Thioclava sp. GXIMD4215 TaxID=3131928 RepID=UPI003252FB36